MSGHQGELDALVRSARAERPRGRWQAQRQLFLRLGLGGGAAMLVARASAAFGPFIRAQRSTLGVAGLALAAAGVLATVYATNLPDAREAAVPSVVPAPSSSAGEHHSVSAEASIPTVSVDALPAVPRRADVQGPVEVGSARRSDEDDLAKEATSVSRIRSKLAGHDFAEALSGVRAHRASFPHGLLAQEVTVLEIEAHQGLGQEERACALGRAFLDAHPTSAHRTRVSRLLRSCNR